MVACVWWPAQVRGDGGRRSDALQLFGLILVAASSGPRIWLGLGSFGPRMGLFGGLEFYLA